MKKVFLLMMAVVAMVCVSCTSNKQSEAAADTEVVANADDVVNNLKALLEQGDVAGFQAALEAAKAKVAELIQANPEVAKEYIAKVQTYLKDNAQKIKDVVGDNAVVSGLVSQIAEQPAEAVLESVKSQLGAAQDAAQGAVDAAQQAAQDAVDGAEQKAKEAVEDAQQAAQDAVDEAKQKAGQAVDNAAQDAAGKLKKGLGL